MGIERDHSHMCKFEDESAPGYDVVAEAIQRYTDQASPIIAKRWIEEQRIRDLERREAASELLGGELKLSGCLQLYSPLPPTCLKQQPPPSRIVVDPAIPFVNAHLLMRHVDSLQQMLGTHSDENATNSGARLTEGQAGKNISLGGHPKSLPGSEGETLYEYEFEEVEEKTMADTR